MSSSPDRPGDRLRRILTEPEQDRLLDAIAADVAEGAPFLGEALTYQRRGRAQDLGIDFPDRPALLEEVVEDLPPPFDTVLDVVIAQNTLHYLRTKG